MLWAEASFGLRWITSESEAMLTLVAPVLSSSTTATWAEGETRPTVSQPTSASARSADVSAVDPVPVQRARSLRAPAVIADPPTLVPRKKLSASRRTMAPHGVQVPKTPVRFRRRAGRAAKPSPRPRPQSRRNHVRGPHGFIGLGPAGLGPAGLGPAGLGPAGLGPVGLGPAGLGPGAGSPICPSSGDVPVARRTSA